MRALRVLLVALLVSGFAVARRHALVLRLAPELRHRGLYVPMSLRHRHDLWLLRRLMGHEAPVVDGVDLTVHETLPGPDGHVSAVDVLVPSSTTAPRGALLWIHGGGYVAGSAASDRGSSSRLARELGCVVVSVDHRLAPEHPFPAALDDCHAALRWLVQHADQLGVDPQRIAVGGASAGAGLAASLAQLVHDEGEVDLAHQLLVYPMLDDRTPRRGVSRRRFVVWTPASNRFGWTAYLGRRPDESQPPPYAAAARRSDLTGLPPAWIGVGEQDLFHDEDVDYARRLRAAGVPCDLHVVPGFHHGADAGTSRLANEFRAAMVAALRPHVTPGASA